MPAQSSFIGDGQQVESNDLNSFAGSASVMTGAAVSAIIGVSDANADDSPLTVVPGAGLSVVVGGLGEKVLVQSRLADYLPAQTLSLAAAGSSARYDLIAFAYADVIVPTGADANFLSLTAGSIAPAPTSYVYRGIRLTVLTGIPNGSLPGAPSGFDTLAQVHVAAGATTIAPADITLLIPTIASRLIALTGGGVATVNGKCGAIAIDAGNSGIAVDNSGSDIKIDNTGVLSLNGQSGAQALVADTGNVTITPHGTSVGIAVTVPAAAGVQSITSANGTLTVTPAGSNVDLAVSTTAKGTVIANALNSQSTTGSLTVGVLPGPSSQQYLVRVMGTTSFHDESQNITLTGSGATWPTSPDSFGNGQGGNTPCAMYGTAHGGQSPTVTWAQAPFGGTGLYLEMFAFPR